MLILTNRLKLLGRTSRMPDFSSMVTIYVYVLFGGLLFVIVTAAARALGADILHHDLSFEHDVVGMHVEAGVHGEAGTSDEMQSASAGPSIKPGVVKFHGMT